MELAQQDGEDFEKANLLLAKFYVDKVHGGLCSSSQLTVIM